MMGKNRIEKEFVSILLTIINQHDGILTEFFLCDEEFGFSLVGSSAIAFDISWKSSIQLILNKAGVTYSQDPEIARIDRWYIPKSNKMGSHIIYIAYLKQEQKNNISEKYSGIWVNALGLENLHSNRKIMSVDILDVIQRSQLPLPPSAVGNELTASDLFFINSSSDNSIKKSALDVVVEAAQIELPEQELIYKIFMDYTLPFLTMGQIGFHKLMEKMGWPSSIIPNLFRTFDMQNRGSLSFKDFLHGIAVVEPITQHGGPPAEIRCRYIFRYYDRDNDGKLSFKEFLPMITDIRQHRGQSTNSKSVHLEAEKSAKVFGDKRTESLGLSEFLAAVGQLKFRGTSHLLRAPCSISNFLKEESKLDEDIMRCEKNKTHDAATSFNFETDVELSKSTHTTTYNIATHSVRVRQSGTLIDIHQMPALQFKESAQTERPVSPFKRKKNATHTESLENFREQIYSNEMINGLRYFAKAIPRSITSSYGAKPAFDWGEVDKSSLAGCILNLCAKVQEVMASEPRLLPLSAPVYILGDFHGNFPDLLGFEKALWKIGPMLSPASFLFLGDYVDRGEFSIEVISYLFAHKLLSPNKFYLIRGNHEIRDVQHMFTFRTECETKFGKSLGEDVWNAVNQAFDYMPLAAVIDDKIFCVHGGIPPPWIDNGQISNINLVPCPLPKPDISPLAWELLWSDPVHLEDLTEEQIAAVNMINGFGNNTRRGTGHVFNADALKEFLNNNNLSHVVRAHELQQFGFQIQLEGLLISVFSSSKYCGANNDAACILVDKGKLRAIRVDTS